MRRIRMRPWLAYSACRPNAPRTCETRQSTVGDSEGSATAQFGAPLTWPAVARAQSGRDMTVATGQAEFSIRRCAQFWGIGRNSESKELPLKPTRRVSVTRSPDRFAPLQLATGRGPGIMDAQLSLSAVTIPERQVVRRGTYGRSVATRTVPGVPAFAGPARSRSAPGRKVRPLRCRAADAAGSASRTRGVRGDSDDALQQILNRNVLDEVRRLRRIKHDAALECVPRRADVPFSQGLDARPVFAVHVPPGMNNCCSWPPRSMNCRRTS